MSHKDQFADLELISSEVLVKELKERGDLVIDNFTDDELKDEMNFRSLTKELKDYEDDEIEEEIMSRSSNIGLMVTIAKETEFRRTAGLSVETEMKELLQISKLL